MSKLSKSVEAMRERALEAIEKKSPPRVVAARGGELASGGAIASDGGGSVASDSGEDVAGRVAIKPEGGRGASGAPAKTKAGPSIRFERGGSVPDVFPDGEVCRLLGKNRHYLIMARKARKKGEDWDAVGHHAGMTAEWILREMPSADLAKIVPWRIKPEDGVVSVEVIQHTMDFRKLVCKRLSDGATVVVTVHDASRFVDGDQFDAQELSGSLRWSEALNRI